MKDKNTEQVERCTTDTTILKNGAAPTQAGRDSTSAAARDEKHKESYSLL